jgi:cytochrome c-type biogenesis protein CcmE
MSTKTVRVAVSAAVIISAFGFLLVKTATEGAAYYKHVDEIAGQHEQWYGRKMNLHGFVVKGSIETNPKTLEWRFQIQNQGHFLKATYQGVVPDTFKDESEVVIKGILGPDGFEVQPGGVTAKCPSRYEPGSPAAGASRY